MSRDIFLGHKVFNINPSSLRSVNFYQELMAERKEYWKERKALLKDDSEAECILCGGGDNELELEYHQYKLFKCNNCSAVFANIRIDDTYTRLVYDNNECKENTKREILDTYEYRKEKFGKERLDYLKEKCDFDIKNDNLLDLGCGPGYFLKHLTELNVECKGLELTQYLVDICREQDLNVDTASFEDEQNGVYNVITMLNRYRYKYRFNDCRVSFKTGIDGLLKPFIIGEFNFNLLLFLYSPIIYG